MDPEQSMPQVSLPTVGEGNSPNPLTNDLDASQAKPAVAGSVLYANQPLLSSTETQSAQIPAVSVPSIADDVDLIEKEWVTKIGDTIHNTKDDPYERARQLALLKSEYLQKRYQKTIKLT